MSENNNIHTTDLAENSITKDAPGIWEEDGKGPRHCRDGDAKGPVKQQPEHLKELCLGQLFCLQVYCFSAWLY